MATLPNGDLGTKLQPTTAKKTRYRKRGVLVGGVAKYDCKKYTLVEKAKKIDPERTKWSCPPSKPGGKPRKLYLYKD